VIAQDLDRDALAAVVPACPEWTVHDLLAHVTAGISDAAAGNVPELEGINLMDHWSDEAIHDALDAMLRRQLDERRDRTVTELVDEWRAGARAAVPMLRGERPFPPGLPPLFEWTVAMDITVHEDDLRGALGLEPAGPSLQAYTHAALWYGMALDVRIRALGRPAMRLEAGEVELDLGEGEPVATLRADPYEATLALTGRRTEQQLRALDWEGDPSQHLDILSAYMSPS
jgi:uncharacterized protein (TIGR03083 family)